VTDTTEIVCIIDRSGSMESIQDDAIGGFNAFLAAQKALPDEARLTLVLFDHEYDLLYDSVPIRDVKPLTAETYVPRGKTALFDAIGRSIGTVHTRRAANAGGPVIVCVLTDGQENASTEYRQAQISDIIRRHREELGWEFVFIAANQDAFATAERMSIARDSAVAFAATGVGVQSAFTGMTNIVSLFRKKSRNPDSRSGGEEK
jgi:Mg-chelatase subunit ChlD